MQEASVETGSVFLDRDDVTSWGSEFWVSEGKGDFEMIRNQKSFDLI